MKRLGAYALPLLFLVSSGIGLGVALFGDGVADTIAALCLALPFAVLARRLRWEPRLSTRGQA